MTPAFVEDRSSHYRGHAERARHAAGGLRQLPSDLRKLGTDIRMSAYFVTATGTDIGKTFVTAGLDPPLAAERERRWTR